MCGILGYTNYSTNNDLLNLISHRGPDRQNSVTFNVGNSKIFLGQTRLSIVELSEAGNQPMLSKDGNYCIIFNGEIYNHLELRNRIKDVQFKGHSDTETILYYLSIFGIESVRDFNGIFSFAFLDKICQKIFFARDFYGIKPLYYCTEGNRLSFCSEIKPLITINKKEIDLESVHTYLTIRYNPSPQTLFKGINKLEPGHFVEYNLRDFTLKKIFYSFTPSIISYSSNQNELIDELEDNVNMAVKGQLMSDVPIAIMLSGGVDSALLAYVAQKQLGEQMSSFTIGYNLESFENELVDARNTSKFLGTHHNEIILDHSKISTDYSKLIKIIEEPVGSQSVYPFYYLSDEIHKKGFKVALSGQGTDESWGGYFRYNFQNSFEKFGSPLFSPLKIFKHFIYNDKIRRGINAISSSNKIERIIESYSFFDKQMLNRLIFSKSLLQIKESVYSRFEKNIQLYNLESLSALDTMLILDLRMALADDLLLYTDKISMANSLEVRVPFLDVRLIRFIESLPSILKIQGGQNKYLFKEYAKRILPEEIIKRQKRGFYIPRKKWYKEEIGRHYKQILSEDKGIFSDLFNKAYIHNILDMHRTGRYNYEDQIYSIMNLFFWIKEYFD